MEIKILGDFSQNVLLMIDPIMLEYPVSVQTVQRVILSTCFVLARIGEKIIYEHWLKVILFFKKKV